MNIVMFGPPAAGKGTQAKMLVGKHSLLQFSTGDMLREARASGTELGKKVSGIMDRSELVSDEIVISIIDEQISLNQDSHGFIFDGFPRTIAQAEALDALMRSYDSKIDLVLSLKVDDSSKRYKQLIDKGIVVRNSSKNLNCTNTLRVTVGTSKENIMLIKAMKEIDK